MNLVDPIVLRHNIVVTKDSELIDHNGRLYISVESVENGFETTPTINADPVKLASWVVAAGNRIICNHCGEYPMHDSLGVQHKSRFCPHCGSRMLGAETGEVSYV